MNSEILRRNLYYRGSPRFLPDKSIVKCLVILIGSGALGYGFYRLFPPLGIYIFIMAGLQFLDALDSHRDHKIEKLDRRDREIEMEIKTAKLERRYHGQLDISCESPSRRNGCEHRSRKPNLKNAGAKF